MRCMICGGDPSKDPVAIYRLNNKGQPGVWACKPHYADAKARYYPDDDPDAPAPPSSDEEDDKPLGPWTGGVTPIAPTPSNTLATPLDPASTPADPTSVGEVRGDRDGEGGVL